MIVSGDFVRRNKLKVHWENEYRRLVQLIDHSTIRTDGTILNAELQFDAPPLRSQELDYDQYLEFMAGFPSPTGHEDKIMSKETFICDLHVIEDLPCDIILNDEFIFHNQVFSRFGSLFCPRQTCNLPRAASQDNFLLFVREKGLKEPWWRRWRWWPRQSQSERDGVEPLQGRLSWEERWDIEERRRNRIQLRILVLPEPQKSADQRSEDDRQASWDRDNPRPTRETRIAASNAIHGQTQLPQVPVPAIIPPTEASARSRNLSIPQTPPSV